MSKESYAVKEIKSWRRYVAYRYSNKPIRALIWYLINKYHKYKETQ